MKLHIIMHESFEGPAAIAQWADENNHIVNYSRVYAGDALPANADDFDFLIVMGGPQSPTTTLDQCPHFNAQAEMRLINQANAANKLILGVCLGAQLIGEAFGAPVEHSPNKEIGVFDVMLTSAASSDPILKKFPQAFPVAHWHGDMPGLTPDSVILAYSEGCPRQIIRYNPRVYGFQCHFEFTQQAIEGLIEHCAHELIEGRYIQTAEELKKQDFREMNKLLKTFLNNVQDL